MVRRLTAHQALQRLRDNESDCSDGELCDSEDPLRNDAPPSAVESDEEPIVTDSVTKIWIMMQLLIQMEMTTECRTS